MCLANQLTSANITITLLSSFLDTVCCIKHCNIIYQFCHVTTFSLWFSSHIMTGSVLEEFGGCSQL